MVPLLLLLVVVLLVLRLKEELRSEKEKPILAGGLEVAAGGAFSGSAAVVGLVPP